MTGGEDVMRRAPADRSFGARARSRCAAGAREAGSLAGLAAAVLVALPAGLLRGAAPARATPAIQRTATPAVRSVSGTGSAPAGTDTAGPAADTLRLGALHVAAHRADPRSRALALHDRAAGARLGRLDARWRPTVRFDAEASYQTDVPTALAGGDAGSLPPGLTVPEPPRDRYDAGLRVEQLLYDGGEVSSRRAVERATSRERKWRTRSGLLDVREEVDAAFFSALLGQERRRQLELLLEDLRASRRTVASRVEEGSVIPAQLAAVDARMVEARQELDAAESDRRAALSRISLLLDEEVRPAAVLALPELSEAARSAARMLGSSGADSAWRNRPDVARLESLGERLRAEADLSEAVDGPRASAFVRGAVGRPGLDFFDDSFSPYATAGIRVRWSFLDWGASENTARALRAEAEIAEHRRRALGRALRRRAESVLVDIDRLDRALRSDRRLIEAQETRRRAALRQLEEGVILPAEYVERRTDVYRARVRRRTHRVELAAARARLMRLLDRPLPGDSPPGPALHPGPRPVPPASPEPGAREP